MMRFYLWICNILVALIYVKCQGCICDTEGTINFYNCTNTTTTCECVEGYTGQFCHQCAPSFFRLNFSSTCQPCGCDVHGASNNTCDEYGICDCHGNSTGDKCDKCSDGFYHFNLTCQECQCNGKTGMCNRTTGVCIDCQNSTTGDHCESCLPGYHLVNDLCMPCNNSSTSSLCGEPSIQPVTKETISISHDTNSPNTHRLFTKIVTAITSSLQPTLSPTIGASYPSNGVSTRVQREVSTLSTPHLRTTNPKPLTNHSRNTAPPTTDISSKRSLAVVLGAVLSLTIIFIVAVVLLVYHCWVKPRRRFFRSPLWTIELRRDEDDTLFNDLQTIDPDVLYLDDAYLMDSARVYNKVTTENSRYHPL